MVINVDDPIVYAMQEEDRRIFTFSIKKDADFYILNKRCWVPDAHKQCLMPLAELPLEGRHNAANALAALALGVSIV